MTSAVTMTLAICAHCNLSCSLSAVGPMFELGQVVHSSEVAGAGVAYGPVYHGHPKDILHFQKFPGVHAEP